MTSSRTRSEFIVAGTALFVSLVTLGVYIYQARMMRAQQHVSVWPYMEWNTSNVGDFHITAQNKGVGPALIRKVEMTVDGKAAKDNRELVRAIMGPDSHLVYINSTLQGRVLIPGEMVIPFRIPDLAQAQAFDTKLRTHDLDLRITYCSVYGDCWVTDGNSTKRLPNVELGLD